MPQPEGVDRPAAVPHHRAVVGHAEQVGGTAGDGAEDAIFEVKGAADGNLDRFPRPGHFPRVRLGQPVVRVFGLEAVFDRLPEHAVLVAQAVPHGRDLQRGQRFDEAGRESSEAAVAEAGVRLLFEQPEPVEVLLLGGLPDGGVEQEVHDVVRQRTSDEKLHRQVVDPLWVLSIVGVFRAHPPPREDVAHRAGNGLELFPRAGRLRLDGMVEDEMPLVERAVRPRELGGAGAVLPKEFRRAVGRRRDPRGRLLLGGHRRFLSPRDRHGRRN